MKKDQFLEKNKNSNLDSYQLERKWRLMEAEREREERAKFAPSKLIVPNPIDKREEFQDGAVHHISGGISGGIHGGGGGRGATHG